MSVRLDRRKPRNWVASLAYAVNRVLPRKLDLMLDLAAVTQRIAWDNAAAAGFSVYADNPFIHKHINPNDRVLEIGCSSGRVLSTIRAAERVGVDYDKQAIEHGRSKYPELTFVHGEARKFLENSGSFDVLILSHVLEHIDDPQQFLVSFKDYFKRIYVEVPDFEVSTLNMIRLMRKRNYIYTDGDHVVEFDRNDLEAVFSASGLTILDREFRWGVMRYWLATS